MKHALFILGMVVITFFGATAFANGLDIELTELVEAQLPAGSEVAITDVTVRGKLPRGYTLELRCDPLRTTNVRALARSADGRSKAWVVGRLDARVPTTVLRTDVQAGERLSDVVTTELVAARELPRDSVQLDELDDATAKRALTAGKVLRNRDIHMPRMIERGQPVAVAVRRGSVVVATRGIAMQGGRRGDIIRVKMSQGRTLDTVVVGPQRTEVP